MQRTYYEGFDGTLVDLLGDCTSVDEKHASYLCKACGSHAFVALSACRPLASYSPPHPADLLKQFLATRDRQQVTIHTYLLSIVWKVVQ
jgi:hypothetical protein